MLLFNNWKKRGVSAYAYSFFVLILSLLYYLSYAKYGVIEGDWGMIAVGAERFLRGEVFYKDFSILYTPGIYLYTAVFFKLFGVSLSSAVIGWSVLRAFNCLIIYLIGVELVSRRTALVLPLLLWLVPGVLHKSFFIFFALLNILMLIKMLTSGSRMFYFISGIAASVTLLFRIDLFGFFLIAAAIVQIMRVTSQISKADALREALKNILLSSCGLAAGIAAMALYLYSNSAVEEAYRQTFGYSDAMKSLWFELPPISRLFSFDVIAIYKYAGISAPFIFYFFIFLIIAALITTRDFSDQKDKKVTAALLYGVMTLNQALMYPNLARIGMILSPVLIADVYFIARYFNCKNNYQKKLRMIYSAALGGLNTMLFFFIIFTCSSDDVYVNGSVTARFKNSVFMSEPRLNVYATYEYAESFNKITDIIKASSKESEYIFAYPGSYQLYLFVTGRKPLEKYALIGEYMKSPERQKEVIRLLEEKKVRVVIAELRLEVQKREVWSPILNDYIMKHYEPKHAVGPFSILVRKEGAG